MRDTLALVAAVTLGVVLAALPFLHYRLGAAHHHSHAVSSADAHTHVPAVDRKE